MILSKFTHFCNIVRVLRYFESSFNLWIILGCKKDVRNEFCRFYFRYNVGASHGATTKELYRTDGRGFVSDISSPLTKVHLYKFMKPYLVSKQSIFIEIPVYVTGHTTRFIKRAKYTAIFLLMEL